MARSTVAHVLRVQAFARDRVLSPFRLTSKSISSMQSSLLLALLNRGVQFERLPSVLCSALLEYDVHFRSVAFCDGYRHALARMTTGSVSVVPVPHFESKTVRLRFKGQRGAQDPVWLADT